MPQPDPHSDFATRPSLLLRLRQGSNETDWERFYDLYAGLIYTFARQRGCSDAMARDVLQETMLILSRRLLTFDYDPTRGRFRSWLLCIVHGKMTDAFRREDRYRPTAEFHQPPVAIDELEDKWEAEWRDHVLQLALTELRRTTTDLAYESFRLSTLEGRPVEEVCEALKLDRNTLYQHRHRATQKLKQLVAAIADELGDPL